LVAKEYVASQEDGQGVLILSETAGAAAELDEALIVNPFDLDQVAATLATALSMPLAERRRRNEKMQRHLDTATVEAWASAFLADLTGA
ncbi:MAG: trehalose-6-phosphate synthase, partial [Sulfobacillus sp.]